MGHVKKHDYHQDIQIKIVLLIIIQNQMKKKKIHHAVKVKNNKFKIT